ncbi:MAG: ATP-binding cassette domain-containing protein, partial [Flavobacteriales bacterium]|nr:ATP-binding cassette domain-containing protein [Flavobacteriales bacterium]
MDADRITLQNIGKRYNQEWIFRGINHTFSKNEHTVILGPNGSGKSTLLQVILGSTVSSEGQLHYQAGGNEMGVDDGLGLFSIATPYLELIEEFTLTEMLA